MITKKTQRLFSVAGILAIAACILTAAAFAYPMAFAISDSVTNSTDAAVLNPGGPITNSDTREVFTVKSGTRHYCFNYYRSTDDNTTQPIVRYGNVRTITTNKSYVTASVSRSVIRRAYIVAAPPTTYIHGSRTLVRTNTAPEIMLKSRRFVPDPGIDNNLSSDLAVTAEAGCERMHVLIQFHSMPDTTERTELTEFFDVELQTYIPNNAWFADIPCESVSDIIAQPNVRWIGNIQSEDKISQHIRDYCAGSGPVKSNNTVNLLVTFFEDVSTDEAEQIIEKYGCVVTEPSPWGGNVWTVTVPEGTISSLAGEDAVEWIESVPPPKTITNIENIELVDTHSITMTSNI